MATFKIIVNPNQLRRDGRYPVTIRLTHARKLAYFSTGYYVDKKELTKEFEVKNTSLVCGELNNRIHEYEKEIIGLGLKRDVMTIKELKNYLVEKTKIQDERIDFIEYAQEIILKLKAEKRMKTALLYVSAIKNLQAYMGNNILYIRDIDSSFLEKYEKHLNGFGMRVPSAYMGIVKTIFNLAKKKYNNREKGIIRINNDPFEFYNVPPQNVAEKRGLTSEVIKKIFAYSPVNSLDQYAKDLFMLSFLTVGTNSIDLFNLSPIEDGYMAYNRSKTKNRRSDKAFIKIRIEPEVLPFFEKYKSNDNLHAFNFYSHYTTPDIFNHDINDGLKIIGKAVGIKKLQFYAARHSWAGIAFNECGISLSDVDEFLNHSNSKLKVTKLYIKKEWNRLAEANRKVIDKVLH